MVEAQKKMKLHITQSLIVLFTIMAVVGALFGGQAYAASGEPADDHGTVSDATTAHEAAVTKFALLAAAIAFGLGAVGAGIAISHVGAAAMGAVAEKPQIAGQALIFVALAEGLVVFGFITALMILGKA